MTLSKAEQIRKRKNKATRLYLRAHNHINADKELLELTKLTKTFFKCKSMKETIKEIMKAFINNKMPFKCTPQQQKIYKKYIKQYMQQYNEKEPEKSVQEKSIEDAGAI